jgi:hypothetical protein
MDSWQRAALNGALHPLHEEKNGRNLKWYDNAMSQLRRRAQHAGAGAINDSNSMMVYQHNVKKLEAISAACRKYFDTKQIVEGDENTHFKMMTLAHKVVQGAVKV